MLRLIETPPHEHAKLVAEATKRGFRLPAPPPAGFERKRSGELVNLLRLPHDARTAHLQQLEEEEGEPVPVAKSPAVARREREQLWAKLVYEGTPDDGSLKLTVGMGTLDNYVKSVPLPPLAVSVFRGM